MLSPLVQAPQYTFAAGWDPLGVEVALLLERLHLSDRPEEGSGDDLQRPSMHRVVSDWEDAEGSESVQHRGQPGYRGRGEEARGVFEGADSMSWVKRVNFRRGLFRVWIILSCLWAILVCAVWFEEVRGEFAKAADRPLTVVHSEPLPQEKPSSTPPVGQITPPAGYKLDAPCTPNSFGDLPVSCQPATAAAVDPFAAYQQPASHPWRMVLEMIAWAVAPPIGMFILGLSCLWAIAGFTRTESVRP